MLSKAHWKQYPNPNFRQQIFTMSHQSRAQLFPFFPFFFSYIRINVRKSFHLPNWQPILYSLLTNANQTKLNTNVRQLHNFFLFLNCWCCCYSWTIWVCVCVWCLPMRHTCVRLVVHPNEHMHARTSSCRSARVDNISSIILMRKRDKVDTRPINESTGICVTFVTFMYKVSRANQS